MKINKTEANILIHRLDCSDGLTEVYNDSTSLEDEIDFDDMYEVCQALIAECEAGEIKEPLEGLRLFAIQDSCEGCTFFGNIRDAVASGEISLGTFMNYMKAAISLSKKTGIEVCTH